MICAGRELAGAWELRLPDALPNGLPMAPRGLAAHEVSPVFSVARKCKAIAWALGSKGGDVPGALYDGRGWSRGTTGS